MFLDPFNKSVTVDWRTIAIGMKDMIEMCMLVVVIMLLICDGDICVLSGILCFILFF